ncbi:MAG: chemotaxis protein CheB [Myxococcaceae bacterium]
MIPARAITAEPRAGRPLRALVLDDDPVFRTVLSRTLGRLGVQVVATCADGASARQRLGSGDVDAVTIDVVLKGESGIDFLKWCRAHHPKVVTVLVTAGTERGARTGVDGVLLGAAALIPKPDAKHVDGFESDLRRVFGLSEQPRAVPTAASNTPTARLRPARRREFIAIGASTGGPPALLKLLKAIPAWCDAPVVITQHMPSLHLTYFAELLAGQLPRPVKVVSAPTPLLRGAFYLASGDHHLKVRRSGATLVASPDSGEPEHHCRPAVDPMFRSLAEAAPGGGVAIVLTGMGSDGASGAVMLRERGTPVLVQDQASSVVWGMPSSVVNAGAADAVVPIDRMAATVLEWMDWAQGGK